MTSIQQGHARQVKDWLQKASLGRSSEECVILFDSAVKALWKKAGKTFSEITLVALMERVISLHSEGFTFLALLKIDFKGVQMGELLKKARTIKKHELKEAMRLVVTDFLSISGKITAEVISKSLHSELAKVALRRREGL